MRPSVNDMAPLKEALEPKLNPDALRDLYEALRGLLDDIEALMRESDGVAGLHLNGDLAPWPEINEGGQFEWLSTMSASRAALAKAEAR